MGAVQSAVFTIIVEHNNPSAWIIGFNIDLWSIIYGVKYLTKYNVFVIEVLPKQEF
jgi:hypothetical protein